MKRCPECRRDYYDETLLYCLEDGTALVQGSMPPPDEPQTAILHETAAPIAAATRAPIPKDEVGPQSKLGNASERQSLSAHRAAEPQEHRDAEPQSKSLSAGWSEKRLIALAVAIAVLIVGGFLGYRFLNAGGGQIHVSTQC